MHGEPLWLDLIPEPGLVKSLIAVSVALVIDLANPKSSYRPHCEVVRNWRTHFAATFAVVNCSEILNQLFFDSCYGNCIE